MSRRIYCPGRVITSIEYETGVYVVTPRIFLRYAAATGQLVQEQQFSFVDGFPMPKRLPQTKERSIDNQFGLGDVTAASFALISDELHVFIGTQRGKLIDYLPINNRIERIVDMSEHAILFILHHQDRTVALTQTGIHIVDNEEQERFQSIHCDGCQRFFPAAKYPSMLTPAIEAQIVIRPDVQFLGLLQTESKIFLVQRENGSNFFETKYLFDNCFTDAVLLPRLQLIFAVNRYGFLAAYKWNGKYLGKFDTTFKCKAFGVLSTGSIIVYTQSDRLFQLNFAYFPQQNKIQFEQIYAAFPIIQYDGYRQFQQWEAEYNQLIQKPEKDRARLDLFGDFLMVIRCNAVSKCSYEEIFNSDAGIFTGYMDSKFSCPLHNTTNSLQMSLLKERDYEKINQSLNDLVNEASTKKKVFAELVDQHKEEIQKMVDKFEDYYADVNCTPFVQLVKYQQNANKFKDGLDAIDDEFHQVCVGLFPRQTFRKMSDVNEENLNYHLENFKAYITRFDFMDFVRARQKVIKKAKQLTGREAQLEQQFILRNMNAGVQTTLTDIVQLSYVDYSGTFIQEEPSSDTTQIYEDVEEYEEPELPQLPESDEMKGYSEPQSSELAEEVYEYDFLPRLVDENVVEENLNDWQAEEELMEQEDTNLRLEVTNFVEEIIKNSIDGVIEKHRQELERLAKLAAEEQRKREEEEERLRQLELERQRIETERLAKLEAERLAQEEAERQRIEKLEQERLAEEERKRVAEQERLAKLEAKRIAKEEAERKRLEELEKKRIEKEEKERIKREEQEAKRQAELKRIEEEKQRKLEDKRKREEEKKRVEEERLRKEEEERKIQEQKRLEREERRRQRELELKLQQEEEARKQEEERIRREEERKKRQEERKLKEQERQRQEEERLQQEAEEKKKRAEERALRKQEQKQKDEEERLKLEQEKSVKKTIVESVDVPKDPMADPLAAGKKPKQKQATKKIVKKEESESEEIIAVKKKKTQKRQVDSDESSERRPVKKSKKRQIDSDESSEPVQKKPQKKKAKQLSESESSSEPMPQRKKKPVISESSSDQPIQTKKKVNQKAIVVESSSEEVIQKKKVKYQQLDSESESSKPPKKITKNAKSKVREFLDSDSESAEQKPVPKKVVKQISESESSESSTPVRKTPVKKAQLQESSDSSVVVKKTFAHKSSDDSSESPKKPIRQQPQPKVVLTESEESSQSIKQQQPDEDSSSEVAEKSVTQSNNSDNTESSISVVEKQKQVSDSSSPVVTAKRPIARNQVTDSEESEIEQPAVEQVKIEESSSSEICDKLVEKPMQQDSESSLHEDEPVKKTTQRNELSSSSEPGEIQAAVIVVKQQKRELTSSEESEEQLHQRNQDADADSISSDAICEKKNSDTSSSVVFENSSSDSENNAVQQNVDNDMQKQQLLKEKQQKLEQQQLHEAEDQEQHDVINPETNYIFGEEQMAFDEFRVLQNKEQVSFKLTIRSVLHSLRATAAAQQAIFAKLARQQQLAAFDTVLEDITAIIAAHFPEAATVANRFIVLPGFAIGRTAWESIMLAYDLRTHGYLSAKQVPGNLCGLQFVRTYRALTHPGILSFCGLGFSQYQQLYIFTQCPPKQTLLDVLQNAKLRKCFDNEDKIKHFITKLLEMIAFLNNPNNKLMHRDLRPSTIWVDLTNPDKPEPKVYHIGFMQGSDCKEPVEHNTIWAAPEVVCGACFMVSDVWTTGTIAYKLAEELAVKILQTELVNKAFGGSERQRMEDFVDSKRGLFTKGFYQSNSFVPRQILPFQEANNAIAVSQMTQVAKDAIVDKKSKRVAIIKDNYLETFAKDQRVKQAISYSACTGKLPWEETNQGYEPSDCLDILEQFGISKQLTDFVRTCWVFDTQKRPKAIELLEHKWIKPVEQQIEPVVKKSKKQSKK